MKKKFGLWLNIVTICLCICAIAIGVYAATSATLTVSGTVGFTAHDCQVQITGTKQGYDISKGTTYDYQKEAKPLTFDDQESITIGGKTNDTINKTANIGTFLFNDLSETYVPDIVISFTAKNLSDFAITFAVVFNDIDPAVQITSTSLEAQYIANKNDTATITLTYKLLNTQQNLDLSDLNIKILCSKFSTQAEYVDEASNMHFYKNAAGTAWTVGPNTAEVSGKVEIPQYANYLPVVGLAGEELNPFKNLPNYAEFTVNIDNATDDTKAFFADIEAQGVSSESLVYMMAILEGLDTTGIVVTPNEDAKVYTITNIPDAEIKNAFDSSKDQGLTYTQILLLYPLLMNQPTLTFQDTLAFLDQAGITYVAEDYVGPITRITTVRPEYTYADTQISELLLPNTTTEMAWGLIKNITTLEAINIPDGVTGAILAKAFENNDVLTSVTIGNGITSIGGNAFSSCTSLSQITIPDSVTRIGSYAFHSCTNLSQITIPDSVTSIWSYAFYSCTNLSQITIPDSVTSIGSYAFSGCYKLTTVYIDSAIALAAAVSNYSSSKIFTYTTAVYIQKDVSVAGMNFAKVDDTVYTGENGVQYLKYTETY